MTHLEPSNSVNAQSRTSFWAALLEGFLSLIFPPLCIHCGRVGQGICKICWQDSFYPATKTHNPIEGIEALAILAEHEGLIRSGVHGLKYENRRDLAPLMAAPLAEKIRAQQWHFDAIIPVPLHFSRLQERGYNQANLLALALAPHLKKPVLSEALMREKFTQSQVGLSRDERLLNVEEAFKAQGPCPARVLLIDDVCTTGATLHAAAQALHEAGAHTVYAATLSQA